MTLGAAKEYVLDFLDRTSPLVLILCGAAVAIFGTKLVTFIGGCVLVYGVFLYMQRKGWL